MRCFCCWSRCWSWQTPLLCVLCIKLFVCQLMAFLCEIPPDLVKVRYTATLIIGRYAFWLVERPHILLPLLNYVIQGFEIPDVCGFIV